VFVILTYLYSNFQIDINFYLRDTKEREKINFTAKKEKINNLVKMTLFKMLILLTICHLIKSLGEVFDKPQQN